MAQQLINVSLANDGLGDQLRDAMIIVNENFTDLYTNKVDAITGKGLSSNDYDNTALAKLAGIEAGAEVNVQSDWNENDDTQDAYILNKTSATGTTFEGTNFIMVYGNSTAVENGVELQAAYDLAALTASSTNIMTVVVCPGYYTGGLYATTDYINVVSLTGNCDVILNFILVQANNCHIKGLSTGSLPFVIGTSGLNNLIVENCKGLGSGSFGAAITLSGTFIKCIGGANSFGYGGTLSGTFIDCEGGENSFGYGGTLSGTFTRCIGGVTSFGRSGELSGTFIDCEGGDYSFGYFGTCSGIFTNCTGGSSSFGLGNTCSGTFKKCIGGNASFGNGGTLSGTFIDCEGGDNSFGTTGILSGNFYNCIAGFGFNGTALSGNFYNCISNDTGFTGEASGAVFNNCIAKGTTSFCSTSDGGVTYYTTGKLLYCHLTSGIFATISGTGRTYYCVDGDGNTNNQ